MSTKRYYRTGEVCEMTDLEAHVLRFWESEFPQLRPKKSRSGHRTYTREDIDLILLIKQLLHEEGFTTAGAIRQLEKRAEAGDGDNGGPAERTRIVGELQEIKDLLQNVLTRTSRNG